MSVGIELVGREREVASLEARLVARRLVTIVGPGGVGKTALALAAAERVATDDPGPRFVDLRRVGDPAAVAGSMAAQLGFDCFDALLASPTVPVLIVVDGCEHVLDGAATALMELLGACDQHTVIATSRAPLDVPGESVLSLEPLALPGVGGDPLESPSVRLFVERCRHAGVETRDEDMDSIVELCQRLDGLPLAIEIAAARARSMTIGELLSRLTQSLQVLDRPRFRGDPRHRSLNATLKWSCDSLQPASMQLLEQLGVFSGSFANGAARAVASTVANFDEALDDLVYTSLVTADTTGPMVTFRLLDTVRQFALAALAERGGVADVYDRFVDHMVGRAVELATELNDSWRNASSADLVAEFDDLAEAMRWCLDHDDSPQRAYELCRPMASIAHERHAADIVQLSRAVLTRFPDEASPGSAYVRAVLATAEFGAGEPAKALQVATDALDTRLEPDLVTVLLLRALGHAHHALGDNEGALEAFVRGAALAGELGDFPMAQELAVTAAICEGDSGRVDDGLARLDGLLAESRAAGSMLTADWVAAARTWLLVRLDPAAALDEATAAHREATGHGPASTAAVTLRSMAFAQLKCRDRQGAAATIEQLLDLLVARGTLSNLRMVLDVSAALAHASGHASWPVLVATARSLPILSPVCSKFEAIPLPEVTERPVALKVIINVVQGTLHDIAAGDADVTGPSTPSAARPSAPSVSSIITRDQFWTIDFEGHIVDVRVSKGLRDIARLVAAEGREIPCTELAGVAVEQPTTGEVIDIEARREYEQRIRDLQADIDEAELDNDYARAYRSQVELDALIEHLTAALSLGQGVRRGSDNTERARTAVAHRLSNTIRQMHKAHPTLGRHLERAIKTGTYCSYRPERPMRWTVQ